jgi:hypothetical protein
MSFWGWVWKGVKAIASTFLTKALVVLKVSPVIITVIGVIL